MKVVVTEGGTANNVGSMALIENAIKIARHKNPNCSISVFCLDPKSVIQTLEKDGMFDRIAVYSDLFPIPRGGALRKTLWFIQCVSWILYSRFILLFCKKISWAFGGRKKKNLQEVEQADYIYCIGAERINDVYYKTALLSLYAIGTYVKMGKKLIHLSLTIGPVFNKTTIYLAKNILNKSYAIFVRDQKSFDILKNWHCRASFQFSSYDIALLQSLDVDKKQSLLQEFGIQKNFVGVSCIYWLFRKVNGPTRQDGYELAIAKCLDYIIEKYNFQIVFTPTVVGVGSYDDVAIGTHIFQKMEQKQGVVLIDRILSPVEMASLLSQCKFSIVTRMHAAILCSGAGNRPIIAISYLYKLREYMRNILCEEYCVDIDYVNAEILTDLIDKLIDNYQIECQKLLRRQVYLREKLIESLVQI
uniref:polysaccharide pyruvyl transferase family protein n=1 Tax=Alistipes sp. Marseille-P5061 TaxID=2048242 RepID=UPI00131A3122|nr:polysaccharide pyruvyl transferase family protein [Alistipes sp. Marseille-P5061]